MTSFHDTYLLMKRLGSVYKNGPVEIHQLPALKDNFFYIFHDHDKNFTAVFDPGDADCVQLYCEQFNWTLDQILITHHHPDHTDGNLRLKELYQCPIFVLQEDAFRIPGATHFLTPNSEVNLAEHKMQVLFTPGHTRGHICFYFKDFHWLICGDTLFSFGCGRLFEGTYEMMLESLKTIRSLPPTTLVFCSHEYTLSNLEFAMSLEPTSADLKELYGQLKNRREQGLPTVPSPLLREIKFNPFLRWDDSQLKKALVMESSTDLEVFTEVRQRRNKW